MNRLTALFTTTGMLLAACAGSSTDPQNEVAGRTSSASTTAVTTVTSISIATVNGGPFSAIAGDALALKVVETLSTGAKQDAPAAQVSWTVPSTVTALAPNSTADSPLPAPGAQPTALFLNNPGRPDDTNDLRGVLVVVDPGTVAHGTVTVSATLPNGAAPLHATAQISVGAAPVGNATAGAGTYASNCAACHGNTGGGSPAIKGPDGGVAYNLDGHLSDFPAPGLNAADGNAASDPDWNTALFSIAAKVDIDNGGVTLRAPMPEWLSTPNNDTGDLLTTQDFADVYAWLKTQAQ